MIKQKITSFIGIMSVMGVCVVVMMGWPLTTQAALPPRVTPAPLPSSPPADSDEPSVGAYIELLVQSGPTDLWTIVQWQDSLGNWHDIEGWQGKLDDNYKKVWWVAPADFGKGPFRWMVYRHEKGEALVASELFYLPRTADETVRVVLLLSSN
jgi:hypothetical protein